MPWLIAYDIEDDNLRTKTAARLLADGCVRLQKSVFAGGLNDTLFRKLEAWLKKSLAKSNNPNDKVLFLDIGPEQLRTMRWIGPPPTDWGLLTDPPDVLFI